MHTEEISYLLSFISITAMKPIWRLTDGFATKDEILIIQGTLQEFNIILNRFNPVLQSSFFTL